jgi:multiple sugar transport system permease protein
MTNSLITSPNSTNRLSHFLRKGLFGRIMAWTYLIVTLIVILFPMWWVVRTAFSTKKDMLRHPDYLTPVNFTTDAFRRVFGMVTTQESLAMGGSGQKIDFMLYLRNSFLVTVLNVAGQLIFSSMAAYAFARLRFPLRDQIFALFLAAMMIPGVITIIPNFILVKDLGWQNTFQGILAPTFLFSAFAIFFMRQFFLGINKELEEAARLDGAGTFGIFWHIILPISRPPMVTIAILTVINSWNDYLWPFLVGQKEEVRVLTVAMGMFRSQTPQGGPDWSGLMAATLVSLLPILIMFVFAGRKIVDSIQFTGNK